MVKDNQSFVDYKTVKGRIVFDGNLKIPVEMVENGTFSDNDLRIAKDVLSQLKDRLLSACQYNQNSFCKVPLSIKASLIIDYKDNQLNLYIEDLENKKYTQVLSKQEIDAIIRKESRIIESHKDHEKAIADQIQKIQAEKLEQTLMHSAYKEQKHNRGSPNVFGKKIDDSLELG